MQSGSWIANGACWSGRPLRVATRRNLLDCSLSIRSWFATPGSRTLPTWLRWSSCASDWLKCNTCVPRLPSSNDGSSANWSKTLSGGSSLPSFCPTAGSVSHRTPAAAARTSGCAWDDRSWLRPLSYGGQEQQILIGLTSLITRNPPMLPKLNRRRALFVLTKINEILAWEQRNEAERDTRFVELGRYLCEVRAGQYWRLEKLKSFDEFLERRFPE